VPEVKQQFGAALVFLEYVCFVDGGVAVTPFVSQVARQRQPHLSQYLFRVPVRVEDTHRQCPQQTVLGALRRVRDPEQAVVLQLLIQRL
jgi:hypothetical protein